VKVNPTNIALILEYDGTNYFGFQLQANKIEQPTIQGELEKAINNLTGEDLRVLSASRTDTGVHAKGQVVSFRTYSSLSTSTFINGLNHFLPGDIAVKKAYIISDIFNIRRNVLSREYSYYILNSDTRSPLKRNFTYHVQPHLDAEKMNQASQVLLGEHDLASFTNNLGDRKTIRNITCSDVIRTNEIITYNLTSNSFLPHQIRNTIGALIQVGLGKMNISGFCDIIKAKKSGLAGPRAPACGLFLMQINYTRPFGEEN
jgi:tRNA pseudouridine38-40 synthase